MKIQFPPITAYTTLFLFLLTLLNEIYIYMDISCTFLPKSCLPVCSNYCLPKVHIYNAFVDVQILTISWWTRIICWYMNKVEKVPDILVHKSMLKEKTKKFKLTESDINHQNKILLQCKPSPHPIQEVV